jgi:hypothetical protein
MVLVELADKPSAMLQEVRWFPGAVRNRVILPMYEVEKSIASDLGIQDKFDLVLIFSSDDKWRRWTRRSTWDGIRPEAFEEADVKDGVDLHILGEV